VQIIALTGGIASGKSTVSGRLAEHGAVVVDADTLAREVVEPGTPGLEAIRERFGDGVIGSDGSLDRPTLGAVVFRDPAALADLNAITHPAVWKAALELFARAEASDPDAIVVYDVPLLVEASAERPLHFDRVVVVEADREERIRRLVQERGMSAEEAERRIGAQAGDAERRAVADVVLDNNGGRDELLRRVDRLWEELRASVQRRPEEQQGGDDDERQRGRQHGEAKRGSVRGRDIRQTSDSGIRPLPGRSGDADGAGRWQPEHSATAEGRIGRRDGGEGDPGHRA
jgi:dephospho-CoA kinase